MLYDMYGTIVSTHRSCELYLYQNWGQRPPSPPENNVSWFLPARYTTSLSSNIWPGWTLVDQNDSEQIQYPSEAASPRQPDKGSRVEGIPNQLFPALLRPRWWWHSYYSRRRRRERRQRGRRRTTTRGKHRVAMQGRRHLSSSPDRPSDAAAFVVRRAARHSSSPPPPGGGSSHGVGLSPIAAPSRARETESNATPHGDRTRDWHRRDGGAVRRDLLLALNSRRQTPLLDAARRGGRRRRR